MKKKKITIRKQEKKKLSISEHIATKKSSKNAPLAPKRKARPLVSNRNSYNFLNKKKPYRGGGKELQHGSGSIENAELAAAGTIGEEASLSPQYANPSSAVPKQIKILNSIQVGELAKKMNIRPSEIIGKLMKMGENVNITKSIDAETATVLASDYGCQVMVVSLYEETLVKTDEMDHTADHQPRPPVVTVMGHVDHGKTLLLDVIRKTNVVAQEAGAITQHIGAYQTEHKGKRVTFLDTPGHEIFTAMRARGAAVTDIVILVVAADEGVKTQTLEAITHAKEAKVPIIVAVNKIDLPNARPEVIEEALAREGLISEKMGGDTLFSFVSAKTQKGIPELLDTVLLQADLLNLIANPKLYAQGRIIEAKVDQGKGPLATLLIQNGSLHVGDIFISGLYSGRVRTMMNDHGKAMQQALPASPVVITGLDGVPEAGDPFQIVKEERYAREIAAKRQQYSQQSPEKKPFVQSADLGEWMKKHQELNIIIKADVQGSVEALKDGLNRLSTEEVKVRVISGSVGAIFDSEVKLADASHAMIVAFQTRPAGKAADLALRSGVKILYSRIIYEVIEDVRKVMEGLLDPEEREEISARAEVRKVFKITRLGMVAGLMINSGTGNRKDQVRVIRDGIVIFTGVINSLKRVKDDVESVREGFECGLSIKDYADLQDGDQIEFFHIKKIARKL